MTVILLAHKKLKPPILSPNSHHTEIQIIGYVVNFFNILFTFKEY